MSRRKKRQANEVRSLTTHYEKQLFDARQLVEISKSLNSTLDYNALVQSILYICMGQLKVLKAGLFARKEIDRQHLILHRSILGFEVEHGIDYMIPEGHPVLLHLQADFRCHSFQELLQDCPELADLPAITALQPSWIVPLRSKSYINGVLILDEPIEGQSITEADRAYVMDIAALAGIAVHNAFLYEVTTTDIMTKLKLRHFFIDVLQDQMALARKEGNTLSLVMVDIDRFKNLNDTYGHLCGDEVIRKVAASLLANIRQTDLAARYGGEEFILLLSDTDLHAAVAIAERIRLEIAETSLEYHGQTLGVTVSMGIAEYDPRRDTNTHSFMERADNAMYQSKREGRNRVSCSQPGELPGGPGASRGPAGREPPGAPRKGAAAGPGPADTPQKIRIPG